MSYSERNASTTFKREKDIVIKNIKEADSGSALVISDKEFYLEKMEEIINDKTAYREVERKVDTILVKTNGNFVG